MHTLSKSKLATEWVYIGPFLDLKPPNMILTSTLIHSMTMIITLTSITTDSITITSSK